MAKHLILGRSRQNTRQVFPRLCGILSYFILESSVKLEEMNVHTGQHGADVNHVETSETFLEDWRCGYSVGH